MNKDLFLALEMGSLVNTENLHVQNSSVLVDVTFEGDTALHIAAREGHTHIVQWILKEKLSLARVVNKDNNTPLHEAAKCGNPDVVRILLQHRTISSYLHNNFGETPLIIASRRGHLETVKILLEARSYNHKIELDKSFRAAAYGRYSDVTQAILRQTLTKPHPFRRLPLLLQWDRYEGITKAIHQFFKKDFRNLKIDTSIRILHLSVSGRQIGIVKAVLDSPTWKNQLMTEKDDCGRCAIHVAAMIGSWDMIDEFMSRWPDSVQIRSSDHKSLLHYAVKYNQFEVVHNLLLNKSPQKAAELVSRDHDRYHNTTLHLAAKNGVDPQLVDYLISFPGVDVNVVNDEGMTALDIASAEASCNPNCDIIKQRLEDVGGIEWSLVPESISASIPSQNSKEMGAKEVISTHMVVASLIATVTFAAIFQSPGGLVEDDDKDNHIRYGTAKMALHKLFKFFIFSDIVAFTSSIVVLVVWLLGQVSEDTLLVSSQMPVWALLFSIFWTTAAFVSATIIITVPSNYSMLKEEPSSMYAILLVGEGTLVFASVCYVGFPLLLALTLSLFRGVRIMRAKSLIFLYLSLTALVLLYLTFQKSIP